MTHLTEDQVLSMSFGTWMVERLVESRRGAGLDPLDSTKPFLVAMPKGMDGALIQGRLGRFTLGNRHAGPVLDLPMDDSTDLDDVRVGTPTNRCAERRSVDHADCHDTSTLFVEASAAMLDAGAISADTHASHLDAARRVDLPYGS
jgi:hypothetical protein